MAIIYCGGISYSEIHIFKPTLGSRGIILAANSTTTRPYRTARSGGNHSQTVGGHISNYEENS